MKPITRREFFAQTLAILSASISVDPLFASFQEEAGKLKYDAPFLNECRIVYQEWIKKESIEPADYLKKTIPDHPLSEGKMTEVTKNDFQNQQIISIKGLQLGKTEAAFLALIGATFV